MYFYYKWLFFTVPWVGLQHAIVVFPDHTHLLLGIRPVNRAIVKYTHVHLYKHTLGTADFLLTLSNGEVIYLSLVVIELSSQVIFILDP